MIGISVTTLSVAVFVLTYLGMAVGKVPGLTLDRAGMTLIGLAALLLGGAVDPTRMLELVDAPTLALLFALMLLSGQFASARFYDWAAGRIAATPTGPAGLLALTIAVAGGLSAVLANDVVVFAMTPILCAGLARRRLDVRPYLIALAAASNAGSAATLIGNPQNILIGQIGSRAADPLGFWHYLALAAPPSLVALVVTFAVVWLGWRGRLRGTDTAAEAALVAPPARAPLVKGVLALALLIALFATDLPHPVAALAIAAGLLVSRRLAPRALLATVDWPLLLLFACLFVITGRFAATGLADQAWAWLAGHRIDPSHGLPLALLSVAASNTIGNVPMVMLLVSVWQAPSAASLAGLALFSTFAGNLLLVGSLANIIVAERAAFAGHRLGFLDHARSGVPITVLSMGVGLAWFVLLGLVPL